MNHTRTSRYLCRLLRHHPEAAGITLDAHGWADVEELIAKVNPTHPLDRALLEEIVRTDNKQRYSYDDSRQRIRANQGHSIPVDVELKQTVPPEILWHGTGEKYTESIDRTGLIPKSRLYVHLSADTQTAAAVGKRHGTPVIYQVDSGRMSRDGYPFFLSENGVWLTKAVPPEYLRKLD